MQTITIKSGDTLSGIAKQYGVGLSEILRLNPKITNPNLIYAGSALSVPDMPAVPPTPPVNPNENLDASKSGRYVIDATNGIDQYDTQTRKKLTLAESQALGLNTQFMPRQNISTDSNSNEQQVGQPITVKSVLKGLGITAPGVSDGTALSEAKTKLETAQQALDEFNTKLTKDLSGIDNNPFLVSSEILGEKRRVINDNQDMLKTLTDNVNKSQALYNSVVDAQNKQNDLSYKYTTLAMDEIKRQADQAYKTLQESNKTAQDKAQYDIDIQKLRNETPAGQSFTIGGKTYTGLKSTTGSSTATKTYQNRLADEVKNVYSGMYGYSGDAREKALKVLQSEFPNMNTQDLYNKLPDGFEYNIGSNKITLSEAKTRGLPSSVVGLSEAQIAQDIDKPDPAQWFITSLKENGITDPAEVSKRWTLLKQLKSSSSGREF
jgi:LysM repeat protein